MAAIRAGLVALVLGLLVLPLGPGPGGVAQAGPQPDEILDDPALEARARALSKDLRCLVCRNESIDDSNAELARDMRLLVRERLLDGDSDDEVLDFIVARYGEFVLLRPRTSGTNIILWTSAPAMFLIALGGALFYLRRRSNMADEVTRLSPEEEERLRKLLRD
ncbi:cytochrome c-type biogenesis protein [Alkalilacustris brevis]|uniref:cytochrome c-type biogenesis protein n=1 Tax=Alkalilacustris brevis TaxID=2026338 RepID=UPI000E0D7C8D|nr:cytochrome c-type biogenesis protein [Alkalilacustris brevis]